MPEPQPQSPPPSPDFGAMFAVHDAVRRDLARAVSLTGGTAPVPPPRAQALRQRWTLLCGVLAAHEEAEEDVLWPRLRAVLSAEDAGPLDVADAQHLALLAALAETTQALDDADAFAARSQRERLAGTLEHVAVRADQHFGLEERRLLPLVATRLTAADWTEFVDAWSAAPGPGGLAAVLPFLLDGAHPDRVGSVLAVLNPQQLTAYSEDWRPAYKERSAELW